MENMQIAKVAANAVAKSVLQIALTLGSSHAWESAKIAARDHARTIGGPRAGDAAWAATEAAAFSGADREDLDLAWAAGEDSVTDAAWDRAWDMALRFE